MIYVLRLLDKQAGRLDLAKLGMAAPMLAWMLLHLPLLLRWLLLRLLRLPGLLPYRLALREPFPASVARVWPRTADVMLLAAYEALVAIGAHQLLEVPAQQWFATGEGDHHRREGPRRIGGEGRVREGRVRSCLLPSELRCPKPQPTATIPCAMFLIAGSACIHCASDCFCLNFGHPKNW